MYFCQPIYHVVMAGLACPKCQLPLDDEAWSCDGCGFELRKDYANIREELNEELSRHRHMFWFMVVVDALLVGGSLYAFVDGSLRAEVFVARGLRILVPIVGIALVATVRASRRVFVLREHLSDLDRRHARPPTAIALK